MDSYTCFILVLILALFSSPPYHVFVSGDSTLIHNTCKNTNNYNLCVSSLKSSPSSLKADTKGLAVIIVNIAMKTANQTTSFLSAQLLSTSNDSLVKQVVKDCEDKYSHAMDALEGSLHELDSLSFDYSYVLVSAAKDYPNVCHNGFKRFAGLAYPVALAKREDKLEKMCDIALGIIDLLGW